MPDLSSTLPTSTVLRVSVRNSLIPLNGVVMSTSVSTATPYSEIFFTMLSAVSRTFGENFSKEERLAV